MTKDTKGRETMTIWVLLAVIIGLAWILFTVFAGPICIEEEDPFFFVREVWDDTEGELNLMGRIICAALTSIACIPVWIIELTIFLIVAVIGCIIGAFCFIFKDRSKDKKDEPDSEESSYDEDKCDGNCGECPQEHDCIFSDPPRIDFSAIYNDKSND